MSDDKPETLVPPGQSTDAWEKTKQEIAGASDDIEKMKKLYAGINAAEKSSLQEIENSEKASTAEAKDATAQPDPNT